MGKQQVIQEILEEVQFRTKEGIVDWANSEHISILAEVLDEMNLTEIKSELIKNLTEGDNFRNSVLNKKIKYRDSNGNEKENLVGNLMRLATDNPGREAAEKYIPKDDSERQEVMDALGNENQPRRKNNDTDDNTTQNNTDDESTIEPETITAFDGESGEHYRDTLPDGDPAKKAPSSEDELTSEDVRNYLNP